MDDMIEKGRNNYKKCNPHPGRYHYNNGCRCDRCKAIMKALFKKYNDRRKIRLQLEFEVAAELAVVV